ncbi:MAG: hypothetical protein ACJAVT_000916, partial [Yoonia sp.]
MHKGRHVQDRLCALTCTEGVEHLLGGFFLDL